MAKIPNLVLTGREKITFSSLDHICTRPGCYKYIEKGAFMIQHKASGTELHVDCAETILRERGVEAKYDLA